MANDKLVKYNEDRAIKTIARRKAIKELLLKHGTKGVVDLKNLLKKEYGISVSRQTVYKDLAMLGGLDDEDMGKIEMRIVGFINNLLNELQVIAEKSKDEKTRILASNAVFSGIKTLYSISNSINQRSARRLKPGEEPKNITPTVVVKFGSKKQDD